MNYLLSYDLFEARLSDISSLIPDDDDFNKNNKKFKKDAELLDKIYLKDYNKYIHFTWNHYSHHNLIDKIKGRTSFISMTEFNDFFEKIINNLIDDYFKFLKEKTIELSKNKIKFCVKTNYVNIIMKLNTNNLTDDYTNIDIITISTPLCNKIDFEFFMEF